MKIVKWNSAEKLQKIRTAYNFFRIILGIVFIYASIDKIINPADFAEIILSYQILPEIMINPIAVVLPWLELLIGVFLIFHIWMPGSIILVNLMLFIFMSAIISALIRGLNIDCGCFSTSGSKGGLDIITLGRDLFFQLMALFLLVIVFRHE
jgi:hypothetical protein